MSSDVAAPGSPREDHHAATVDDEAYEPTYAEAFPPLPAASSERTSEPVSNRQAPAPQWKKLSLKTSTVTQVGQEGFVKDQSCDFKSTSSAGEKWRSYSRLYSFLA